VVKKLLLLAETCFVVFGLIYYIGGLVFGVPEGQQPSGLLLLIVTMIRYFIWLVSAILLLLNGKRVLRTIRRDWVFWIFTLFVLCSFAWSDFPVETVLNNREIAQMTCFGLYFAARFELKQQIRLLALTFGIGAILSTLVAIGLPSIGKHATVFPGAWKGVFSDKNTFGGRMLLGAVAFYALPIERSRDVWIKWIGIAFLSTLIILSTSKTALVLLVVMLLFLQFYKGFRWQGNLSIALTSLWVLVLGGASVLVFSNWTELLRGLGRDPTLTGRTYIWVVAIRHIIERPLFGFGRSAFWLPQSPYPQEVRNFLPEYVAPHSHNGLIDITLDVGLIGLILFLICFVTAYAAALKQAYASKRPEYLWALGFLTYLALNNVTESFLLRLENINWVLFITVVLTVKQRFVRQVEEPILSLPEAVPQQYERYPKDMEYRS
jgi:O-antigen ligase